MQAIMRKFKTFSLCLMMILLISGFFGLLTQSALANYNSSTYGQCTYGGTCSQPTTSRPGQPASGGAVNSAPDEGADSSNTTIFKKLGTRVAAPLETLADKTTILLQRLTPAQRRLIPFLSWYLLIISALILFLESFIERHRIAVLRKTIITLQETIDEQKNFARLVLHNLNTPVATAKNMLEMLASNGQTETEAVGQLKAPTLGLAATADYVSGVVGDSDPTPPVINTVIKFRTIMYRWYFWLPASAATLLGLFLNWALSRFESQFSFFSIIFQLAIALVSLLIFANAIRVFKIIRTQRQALNSLKQTSESLDRKRRRVIAGLSANLGAIIEKLQMGAASIRDTHLRQMYTNSLSSLEKLSRKITAATASLPPRLEPCDVPAIVQHAIVKYVSPITDKHLTTQTAFELPSQVYSYPERVAFMVESLLENAITFSQEGGSITIKAAVQNNQLQIMVHDDGPSLSRQEQAAIFQPFSQAHDVLTADHQGTGLSLYACKSIASKMGGTIRFDSSESSGTTSGILLPLPT